MQRDDNGQLLLGSVAIASSTMPKRPSEWNMIALMLAPFGFIFFGAAGRKRQRWLLAVLIAALIALAACGGGSMNSTSTTSTSRQAVTQTVVVTATSAGVAHSTSVSLTVQ